MNDNHGHVVVSTVPRQQRDLGFPFKPQLRKRRPAVCCMYIIRVTFYVCIMGYHQKNKMAAAVEDRIDAHTHVVGNYCKLATESIKPLIHRDNSSRKANMAFNRGFIVLKLAKNCRNSLASGHPVNYQALNPLQFFQGYFHLEVS